MIKFSSSSSIYQDRLPTSIRRETWLIKLSIEVSSYELQSLINNKHKQKHQSRTSSINQSINRRWKFKCDFYVFYSNFFIRFIYLLFTILEITNDFYMVDWLSDWLTNRVFTRFIFIIKVETVFWYIFRETQIKSNYNCVTVLRYSNRFIW